MNSLSGSDFHDLIAKLTTVLQNPHRRERGEVCIVCTCLKITFQIWRTVKSDYRVVKIPLTTGLDSPDSSQSSVTICHLSS